jgi:hypothetical protein
MATTTGNNTFYPFVPRYNNATDKLYGFALAGLPVGLLME